MKPKRALFLDRDGVINIDHGYVHRIEDFEFIPGIFSLVRSARRLGYRIIVVTNQAGIGRGYYSEAQFLDLSNWMQSFFHAKGATLDAIYHCPHHPEHGIGEFRRDSPDRKPKPGMLLRAAKEWQLDLHRSALVGDRASDIEAAVAAGVPHRYLFRSNDHSDHAVSVTDLIEVSRQLAIIC